MADPIRSRQVASELPMARRSKRVSTLALSLISAVPVVIYAWHPMTHQMRFLRSASDCSLHTTLGSQTCNALIAEAQARNAKVAPSYDSQKDCDRDFPEDGQHYYASRWESEVSHCEPGDDGRFRPSPTGFMVSRSALSRLKHNQKLSLENLALSDLQPIYAVDESAIRDRDDNDYASTAPYFFSGSGGYLGRGSLHGKPMNRWHLATSGQHYTKSEGLPGRFSSSGTARGGFGRTAHASLARSIG